LLTETLCELKEPTVARMRLVNATTNGVLLGCYLPVSVAGYLIYSGQDVPSNMLSNLRASSLAVQVARLVIGGLLFFTYALFIIPLRRRVETWTPGDAAG
jgi:Transmembrane amino acid transporter protein